jgi:hypothetical protein
MQSGTLGDETAPKYWVQLAPGILLRHSRSDAPDEVGSRLQSSLSGFV